MTLSLSLYNALTGLQANQRALDVTSQNVSNVNTDGYSRKVVNQQAISLAGIGAGVEIASVTRNVSEYLLKDVRGQTSIVGNSAIVDEFYQRMQDLFGTPGSNSSIASQIADVAEGFQALSAHPEDVSARIDVVNRARFLVQQFNDIAGQIQNLRLQADSEIERSIEQVNSDLSMIQELNVRIAQNRALGFDVADMQDQRDNAVARVAQQMDITTFGRDAGDIVVMSATGRILVDREAATLSHSAANNFSPSISWADGTVDGIDINGVDITSEFRSGRIAALIDMRDTALPNFYSQINELGQALHDEMNVLHNQGTAFPGVVTLTGSHSVAGADTPVWTGEFRVAVTDDTGTVVEVQDFDLSTYATVSALVADIDAMTNVSAAINADGKLVLTGAANQPIALSELDSAVTVGNRTVGASDFFGLNDFLVSGDSYDTYTAAQQTDRTAALNVAGSLTFTGSFGTATVAYLTGNSIEDVAAAINLNATLAAANITASVITDGSGSRLRISDADSNNFFITDTGALTSNLNIRARGDGLIGGVAMRADVAADPSHLSRGVLSSSATLAAGNIGVTAGDNSTIQAIVNLLAQPIQFDATGELAGGNRTISGYAGTIISLNATQASNAADALSARELLLSNLKTKAASVAGVNLDEELANMVLLQNAYAASARVITTTQTLFDVLNNL